MKLSFRNTLFTGIAALALVTTPMLHAVDAKTAPAPAPAPETVKPKRESYPFKGIVASVNNSAKSIALKKKEGERVLKIDSTTKITVDGKPATLADVKPELYAHGSLHKENGEEYILSAKFDKEAPAKKEKTVEPAVVTPAAPKAPAAVVAPVTPVVPAVDASAATNTTTDKATAPKKKKKKVAAPAAN